MEHVAGHNDIIAFVSPALLILARPSVVARSIVGRDNRSAATMELMSAIGW